LVLKMPVAKEITVMPIWIEDSSVVGSAISARAILAPARPCSAWACRRARLAATSAISDSAKNPFSRISSNRIRTSRESM
jgi:hypothetical protein